MFAFICAVFFTTRAHCQSSERMHIEANSKGNTRQCVAFLSLICWPQSRRGYDEALVQTGTVHTVRRLRMLRIPRVRLIGVSSGYHR